MNTDWDPDLYLKFQRERTQPSIDLVNRIEFNNPKRIIDAGCGPGNSTAILRKKWPDAHITGIDNSKQMIETASNDYPDDSWMVVDVMDLNEYNEYDIVFSNAVIQWLPNHEKVIPHLLKLLKPKGVLAVQVPQNQFSGLHKALCDIADEEEFRDYTGKASKALNYRTGEYYYDLLCDKVNELYIWETTYFHIIKNHDDLINWYKSTGMKPFLGSLPVDDLKSKFLKKILERCKKEYKIQSDGRIIFPFKRLFFIGYK